MRNIKHFVTFFIISRLVNIDKLKGGAFNEKNKHSYTIVPNTNRDMGLLR